MSTGKGKGRKEAWDGEAHKALAVALFRTHGTFVLEQQAAVVKDMNDNGFGFTWEAIRQHLQKLKKKEGGNSSAPSGTPSVPATPKKAKPAAAKAKTPTPRNRKRQAAHALDNDEDEDEFLAKKKLKLEETDMDQIPRFGGRLADELATSEDGEV